MDIGNNLSIRLAQSRISSWETAGRPNTKTGKIGYNSDLDCVEFYDGASWRSLKMFLSNTTRVTTTYTALVTDQMIYADTDGGVFTITLPAGVEGQEFRIANVGTSGNDLTIDGDGAEKVRGATTKVVSDNEIMILIYNTTEGWI